MIHITCQACADCDEEANTEVKVEMSASLHQAQPWHANRRAVRLQAVLGAVVHAGRTSCESVIPVGRKLELQANFALRSSWVHIWFQLELTFETCSRQ